MTSFLGFADLARPLSPTQQVRLELRSRPGRYLTNVELVGLTGLKRKQINDALAVLTRQGRILRRIRSADVKPQSDQAYAWNHRGAN